MLRSIAFALTVLALAPVSRAQNALAVNWQTGSAWSVNTTTWIETSHGPTGAAPLNGLAVRDEFVAYACGSWPGATTTQLHTIDPATGAVLASRALPLLLDLRALAWDVASSTLLAVHDSVDESDELWRIDPATLSTSLVGFTGTSGIQGLDFGPDGTLWSYDVGSTDSSGQGLVALDPLTGAISDPFPSVDSQHDAQWVVVADDGTVYVGRGDVYRVDPVTGADTWVAFIGNYDLRGLDNVPGRGFPGAFCFGDGSGAICPCGNSASDPGGCRNSTGAGAQLTRSGTPSVSASDLQLLGAGLPPSLPGMYFQGTAIEGSGNGTPFGDGLRCVGTSVIRLEVAWSGSGGTSSSSIAVAAAGDVAAGDTRYYQLWYRDPRNGPCGLRFNLTNGLAISWSP